MFEVPGSKITSVTVDEDAVLGKGSPIYAYNEIATDLDKDSQSYQVNVRATT